MPKLSFSATLSTVYWNSNIIANPKASRSPHYTVNGTRNFAEPTTKDSETPRTTFYSQQTSEHVDSTFPTSNVSSTTISLSALQTIYKEWEEQEEQ